MAGPDVVGTMLGSDGAPALFERLDEDMRRATEYTLARHAGFVRRAQWSRRRVLKEIRWDRKAWATALENAGVGTVARLTLTQYGIACDDECMVVFDEVLDDWLRRTAPAERVR